MKILLSVFLLIFHNHNCGCNQDKSNSKFESFLEIVEDKVINGRVQPNLSDVVRELERITNIDSGSDATYFGKLNPTDSSLVLWKVWFEQNKGNLCWNDRKEIFFMAN